MPLRPSSWRLPLDSPGFPLIVGHRGMSRAAPENTIEGFRMAYEAGVDGIELDVRLTKDRKVVVIHDASVNRTTNGQGRVSSMTLAEIQRLDAGSWFDPKFKNAKVTTLDEVFESLPHDFLIDVEVKIFGLPVTPLVTATIDVIRRHNRLETAMLSSFSARALDAARRLEPKLARGSAWSRFRPYRLPPQWFLPVVKPHWVQPEQRALSPKLIAKCRRRVWPILAWDVDAGLDYTAIKKLGVQAVVSDSPDLLVRQRAAAGPNS